MKKNFSISNNYFIFVLETIKENKNKSNLLSVKTT